ncbi:Protein VMS1 [Grifola frondosa]|uniref:Protein VMS1 n=1 Tax=Grifola frondosa TaxID=5627 RepID=A0A1C7M9A5_GRIFR|nr:Protein VMS1 [Grifola frondosa]
MSSAQYHVFSLPRELLGTLVPRNIVNQTPSPPRSESPAPAPSALTGARACNICLGITFVDVEEQRVHFRSDWHRYNVKMRLNGGNVVAESQFAQLVDGLEDSISGSASSSEGESDESDAVDTLVRKTRRLARSPSPASATPTGPQTPLAWFHSPPSTQIGVYKALHAERWRGGPDVGTIHDGWGHFAGAIVRVKRPDGDEDDHGGMTKKGKPRKPKPDIEVIKHKTFHRYTTRRKQGGSQSLNDNAKSKAVSAGAMLRRYGEQALRDDIRNLIQDWADEINSCERIWIRASVSNRRIFLDYEGAIISKGDERLRTFPFPTRRPTQSELTRCLFELTRVKVSHLTEEALHAQDEAFLASLPKPKSKPAIMNAPPVVEEAQKEKKPLLSHEEEQLREKWTRLVEMVTRGRMDALKAIWEREGVTFGGVDARVPEWLGEKGGTLLQIAAHAGQEAVTRWLLEDVHANPTVDVPNGGVLDDEEGQESDASDAPALPRGSRRTAYDLARTRAMRNLFRRCAAAHPDWWDWLGTEKGARVPSVLSAEMEEGREEKKKARRKGLKDRVREREAKEKEKDSRVPSPVVEEVKPSRAEKQAEAPTGPRRLGGSVGATESVAGLTPEMRAKVERERRARAAEARLKALGGVR